MSQERYEELNLNPPEESFEFSRYNNFKQTATRGWLGLCTSHLVGLDD